MDQDIKKGLIIGVSIVGGILALLLFWKAILALGIIVSIVCWLFSGSGGGSAAEYGGYQQQPPPQQGWDYHGNQANLAIARGEYYQVPREGWTQHDLAKHALASSRGNAWVPGLGETSPENASIHYDGPGRDAWWYTSRGMQPPR